MLCSIPKKLPLQALKPLGLAKWWAVQNYYYKNSRTTKVLAPVEYMETKNKSLLVLYEVGIIILAVIAVTITVLDLNNQILLQPGTLLYNVDLSILLLFILDYFVRLIAAKDKRKFFKKNIFDLVAIIPFNSMFRIFRTFRLFRVLKVTKILKMGRLLRGVALLGKIKSRLNTFINTNGFIYIIYISIITIILSTLGIHYFEFNLT